MHRLPTPRDDGTSPQPSSMLMAAKAALPDLSYIRQALSELLLGHAPERAELDPRSLGHLADLLGSACEERVNFCLARSRASIDAGLGGGGLEGLEPMVLKCLQARQHLVVPATEEATRASIPRISAHPASQ
jgi:hypothetical protein